MTRMLSSNRIAGAAGIITLVLGTIVASPAGAQKSPATTSSLLPIAVVAVPVEDFTDYDSESVLEEIIALTEEAAVSLGRFEIIRIDESGLTRPDARRLEVRLLSYSQERIWVEDEEDDYEDDDEDDEDSDFFFRFLFRIFFGGNDDYDPDSDDDGHWEWETNLRVALRLTLEKSGAVERTARLESFASDRSRGGSRGSAISGIEDTLEDELRRMYLLRSPIDPIDEELADLRIGSEIGVERGMLFSIGQGSGTALGKVESVATGESRLRTVRRWAPDDGSKAATELVSDAVDIWISGGLIGWNKPDEFQSINRQQPYGVFGVTVAPYSPVFGAFSFRFGVVEDSRRQQDFLLGMDFAGGAYLHRGPTARVAALAGLGGGVAFREDDAGDEATTLVGSLWPAIETNVLLTRHIDLTTRIGYRFGNTSNDWEVTPGEEEETVPATWDGKPPAVTTTGAFLTVGIKFSLF